jgi:hypothetical protein
MVHMYLQHWWTLDQCPALGLPAEPPRQPYVDCGGMDIITISRCGDGPANQAPWSAVAAVFQKSVYPSEL